MSLLSSGQIRTKNGQEAGQTRPYSVSSNSDLNYSTSTTVGQDKKVWFENKHIIRTRASGSGDVSDTVPTAAQFLAYMSEVGLDQNGCYYELDLTNGNALGAGAWVLVTNTGVTLGGAVTIAAGESIIARIVRTTSSTITIYLMHPTVASRMIQLTDVASTVLTADQSGATIYIPQADAQDDVITLPALAPGLWFRFIFQAVSDGTQTITIKSAAASGLSGAIMNVAAAAYTSTVIPASTIVRSATANNTKAGDYLECHCDGTKWYFTGHGLGAAATFSIT